jgi:hypothetical protein
MTKELYDLQRAGKTSRRVTTMYGYHAGKLMSHNGEFSVTIAADRRVHVETLPSGERVIVNPSVTNSRGFLYLDCYVNVGSLTG